MSVVQKMHGALVFDTDPYGSHHIDEHVGISSCSEGHMTNAMLRVILSLCAWKQTLPQCRVFALFPHMEYPLINQKPEEVLIFHNVAVHG